MKVDEYTGPSDAYYDPPEDPTEEDECSGCGEVKQVDMKLRLCEDCVEGLRDAADEAKVDEAKDEGRRR